ncbi:YeeE/YedE family protein [Zoogloea sp.]|uniref:YeeE/YedE family protein n=1 Tax=Zoogloea sp. TaxID=49181 RepID=UPI00260C9EA1|nr:YeeE/YedE family protein [uncultured Zoogloea sp.]
MIDYESFTPLISFVGGCMIGLAVVILFLGDRRIAGVSGIFGEILTGLAGEGRGWRLLFVAGMLLAPWVVTGSGADGARFGLPFWGVLIAGFLTGYGTRIARGCTSGHGVCGLSRLSLRSLVAVLTFMTAGMVTVTVVRIISGGA